MKIIFFYSIVAPHSLVIQSSRVYAVLIQITLKNFTVLLCWAELSDLDQYISEACTYGKRGPPSNEQLGQNINLPKRGGYRFKADFYMTQNTELFILKSSFLEQINICVSQLV